mgnify:FL=1
MSTAKTSNFSTDFEIKVFKGPNYVPTFIVTVAVRFAFSSNILQILLIFIHKKEHIWQKNSTFVLEYTFIYNMNSKHLNRIKVALAEKEKTNKWLAEQLGKDQATISKWVTNTTQPNLEMLLQIAKVLEVNVNELVRPM